MLPFLKQKPVAGIIIAKRKPDGQNELEGDDSAPLEACASDLIQAIHAKDAKAAAEAFKAAFEILEASPHEESPHLEDEEE